MSDEKVELKPCPCGSKNIEFRFEEYFGDYRTDTPWTIYCLDADCPWQFVYFATQEEAIAAWNTRAGEG